MKNVENKDSKSVNSITVENITEFTQGKKIWQTPRIESLGVCDTSTQVGSNIDGHLSPGS